MMQSSSMDSQPTQVKNNSFIELCKFICIVALIFLPIRYFVAKPFIVNGASMDPTFVTGEYLIVDQLTYHFEKPKRGDVIVFKYPYNEDDYYIKRVIGLPGETVESRDGVITIKNAAHPKGFILNDTYIKHTTKDSYSKTLGDSDYFVLGDNRQASSDSHIWGELKEKFIIGRPFVRLVPLTRIKFFPGEQELPQ
jgi:signal peptidase I